jgi:serine/threonine protein phosphatase PrpC
VAGAIVIATPAWRAGGASHPGRVRDHNEDRLLVDLARGVFGVVDGVGGHPGGAQASEIAVTQLAARLARDAGSPGERLREAITLANNAILETADRDPSLVGMACVLTAAVITGPRLTVGHVGDSRLYKIHGGAIRKLTRDHSPVGEREDAGEISELEAMRHPRRNEVYRDVGGQPHAPDDEGFVDITEDAFEPDAALVICSDGLSDLVLSTSIRQVVEARAGDPQRAADDLVRAANDAGGKDNVTVVVVEGLAFGGAGNGATPGATGSRRRSRVRDGVLLALGTLLGVLASAAALWTVRPDVFEPSAASVVPPSAGPTTWQVGLAEDADAASIAEAMGLAQPGDTIQLSAGEYREPVTITKPLTIQGPAQAVVRPPVGTAPGWTAVTVPNVAGVRLVGFSIANPEHDELAVGIRAEGGGLVIESVSVSGTTEAGLLATGRAVVTVSGGAFHDNHGSAIVVGDGTRLVMQRTTVLRNGATPGRAAPAIRLDAGADAVLTGNAIGDNAGAPIAGLPPAAAQALSRDNFIHPAPQAGPRRQAQPPAPRPARPDPVP